MKKKMLALLLAAALVVCQLPIWADGAPATTPAQEQKPQFSMWALGELNEAEKYGLYDIEWYKSGFLNPISEERFKTLGTNLQAKLKEINLNGATKVAVGAVLPTLPALAKGKLLTRKDVINAIFDQLGHYDPNMLIQKSDVVSIMSQRGIIKGEKGGLYLERPCSTQEAVLMSARAIQYLSENTIAGAKGLAWKVSKGDTTLYLLGSIHLASTAIYPMDQRLVKAYEGSDGLYVEANIINPMNGYEAFMKTAQLEGGKKLKDVVDATTYTRLEQACKNYGVPMENLAPFKPWMVALTMSNFVTTASTTPEETSKAAGLGIDAYFLTRSLLNQKPVVELEGLEFQGKLFDSLTDDYEVKYLNSVVDSCLALASTDPNDAKAKAIREEAQKGQAMFKDWLMYWQKGDKASFKKTLDSSLGDTASADSEITAMLLGKRDQAMAEKLSALLEKGEKKSYFIVVGAAHLVTDKMVIDILKAKGYKVEEFYQ